MWGRPESYGRYYHEVSKVEGSGSGLGPTGGVIPKLRQPRILVKVHMGQRSRYYRRKVWNCHVPDHRNLLHPCTNLISAKHAQVLGSLRGRKGLVWDFESERSKFWSGILRIGTEKKRPFLGEYIDAGYLAWGSKRQSSYYSNKKAPVPLLVLIQKEEGKESQRTDEPL